MSFSVSLTFFFVSSAQDSGKASRKTHNKCLPVIFLMMMMMMRIMSSADDTVIRSLAFIH